MEGEGAFGVGKILLACLVAENTEIAIINESLGNFIEFLYRIGRYKAFSSAVAPQSVASASPLRHTLRAPNVSPRHPRDRSKS